MSPKYRPGDRVIVPMDRSNVSMRPGIYTITRVMPASPEGIRYRAKNEMDTHERVLDEAQLQPAPAEASVFASPTRPD
jgi:hypothetical protein